MEILRRLIRPLIGSRSRVWRFAARTYSAVRILFREGRGGLRTLRRLEQGSGEPEPVQLAGLQHSIWVRPGSDDIHALINNAVRDEWGSGFARGYAPQLMIDGGAFIGDSAAVFLSRFPGLKVIACEPNPDNLVLARRNLEPYGDRAEIVAAALWHEDARLRFGGASIHGGVDDGGDIEVAAISLPRLIESNGHVDILKLDIEGAEEDLFRHEPERWLSQVDHLLIELHSPTIAALVLPILRREGFKCRMHRSVWHCTRSASTG